jgi:hypothetical protein
MRVQEPVGLTSTQKGVICIYKALGGIDFMHMSDNDNHLSNLSF